MNKETIISMDPHILVSMVNMKLRDFYSSLESFCEDIDINIDIVEEKLKSAGYEYNEELNQFK